MTKEAPFHQRVLNVVQATREDLHFSPQTVSASKRLAKRGLAVAKPLVLASKSGDHADSILMVRGQELEGIEFAIL